MRTDDRGANRGLGKRLLTMACGAALVLVAVGCASQSVVRFLCDSRVNDGVLLTIDLIQVNESEAAQIRQAGGKWFYSPLRPQLALRTKTIAVRGGCAETVELAKPQKGYDILAIVAEYQTATSEHTEGNTIFRMKKDWQGERLLVSVRDAYLSVTAEN
jgi:hypothetical protein